LLKDGEGKIAETAKSELEAATLEAKTKMTSEVLDDLKAATERLQNVSHKIASEMYAQAGQAGGEQASTEGEAPGQDSGAKNDDDVVDADYKEV